MIVKTKNIGCMFRKLIFFILIVSPVFLSVLISADLAVIWISYGYIHNDADDLTPAYTVLVPGARVYSDGRPSQILTDRLDKALELYKAGKVKRFLLSGDHGILQYDEVNHMKDYLLSAGVPLSDIFTDHAGFDTYNSITRAKEVFEVNTMIIVTQKFHLKRAVFIARMKGLTVQGYVADKRKYASMPLLFFREKAARIKAFWEVQINRKPRFYGNKIPIKGNSINSHD